MRRAVASFMIAAAVTLSAAMSVGACPMCVEQLPSETSATPPAAGGPAAPTSGAGNTTPGGADLSGSPQLAEGFYYSILLMLAVPYALAVGGGVTIYTLLRRAK